MRREPDWTYAKALLLLLLALLLPAPSAAADLDSILASLTERYSSVKALSADFTQETIAKGAKRGEVSKGKVWFKRPGKMRWVYETPVTDEITGNGKYVWIFQPDINQVIEKPVDNAYPSITTDFLGGIETLKKDFKITLAKAGTESYLLNLEPLAPDAGIRRIAVGIDRKSGFIVKTVAEDPLGGSTTVRFERIRTNAEAPDSIFEFKPPKGATVVRP
ncbi:MAG: outer membrane lipoprotein chaperone LolA [Deltaproteobacteria bacterium]|nr:outer membrane lipoprotein chaperone LolA [Deltaproteobacteria bacterium]